jgi:antitoxin HicB
MPRRIHLNGAKKKPDPQALSFTVLYLPVSQRDGTITESGKSAKRGTTRRKHPERNTGYQVIVPLMPGLVTFGRTLEEAQEMARDAIECHIEGLKKSGEPIPNERLALRGELRVALSA